jgi:hypothetical protein
VRRLKLLAGSISLTPLGALVLVVLVGAIAVVLVGPKSAQPAAFILAALMLLFTVGGRSGGRAGGRGGRTARRSTKSIADGRAEFHARSRSDSNDATAGEASEELWRRERERRETDGRTT